MNTQSITYVLGDEFKINGSTKVIVEHCNYLASIGCKVKLISPVPFPENWVPLNENVQVLISKGKLPESISKSSDIIVTSDNMSVKNCHNSHCPTVYFEQGGAYLYEDLPANETKAISEQVNSADYVLTLSEKASDILKNKFDCKKDISFTKNAVDRVFSPPEDPQYRDENTLLVIGSHLRAKGIPEAFEMFNQLKNDDKFKQIPDREKLKLIWATPDAPDFEVPEGVEVHLNASQKEISDLYKKASILISPSHYDTYQLTSLEGMQSGCGVVVTDNGGVPYAKDGSNCLITRIKDSNDLAEKTSALLTDRQLYKSITQKGIETANNHTWRKIIPQLLQKYNSYSLDFNQNKQIQEPASSKGEFYR